METKKSDDTLGIHEGSTCATSLLEKLENGRFKVSRDITEIIDDHCEE